MPPPEILHKILREATVVPEAFDTSFDGVLHEDQEEVLNAIRASMITKKSLSLVSKTFHDLAEEFLYEIVFIRRFKYIPHLSKLLRNKTTGRRRTNKPHGQQCRRLQINLGTSHIYADTAWYEGGHTLWGLIAACPNINILLCHVWELDKFSMSLMAHRIPTHPHLTHPSLWKLIASTCGPRLQRMELFGFSIRMDRVEMMLRYCTMLEVCHLVHVRPYSDEEEIYDSEEPIVIKIPWRKAGQLCRGIVTDKTNGSPSGLFDAKTRREFKKAKLETNTYWPTCSLKPPYTLSSLHTFHIDEFNPRLSQLQMPNLRRLGLYNRTEQTEYISCSFSSFPGPNSLRQLSCGFFTVPFEVILNTFPNITELYLQYGWEESTLSAVKTPHTSLTIIKYRYAYPPNNHFADLLSVIKSGMLPALREVCIVRSERLGSSWEDDNLPVAEFRMLGVAVGVNIVKPRRQPKRGLRR